MFCSVTIGSCHGVDVGSIKWLVVQMRQPMDVRPVGMWTSHINSITSVKCGTDSHADTLTTVDTDDQTQLERIDATWTALTKSGFGDVEIRCELTLYNMHRLTQRPSIIPSVFAVRVFIFDDNG